MGCFYNSESTCDLVDTNTLPPHLVRKKTVVSTPVRTKVTRIPQAPKRLKMEPFMLVARDEELLMELGETRPRARVLSEVANSFVPDPSDPPVPMLHGIRMSPVARPMSPTSVVNPWLSEQSIMEARSRVRAAEGRFMESAGLVINIDSTPDTSLETEEDEVVDLTEVDDDLLVTIDNVQISRNEVYDLTED